MSYIFVSDLHLSEQRMDVADAFVRFLSHTAGKAEKLFILGDLFEVWLGDDHESDFNSRMIASLASLSMPRYIMHGNRDFLMGTEFCARTGLELLEDPTRIELFDEPALLMHGDSLCTQDTEYMKSRSMLRDPDFQKSLLAKTVEERAAIAADARSQSKQHTAGTAMEIMDVTPEEVSSVMSENDVSLLIHGHTHRPQVHEVQLPGRMGKRIVLGDWDRQGWYLEVDQHGSSLKALNV